MDAYIYKPVGKAEIRLVTVKKNERDQLEATIQHVELDEEEPVRFTAVSYTWGDPSNRVQLPCGSSFLSITTSLYEALGEIINVSPHEALWIDQICINQEDHLEKAVQVGKMDVIYDKAETVLAWLGPAGPTTAAGVDFVKKVGEIALPTATDIFRRDSGDDEDGSNKLEKTEEYSLETSRELGIPFDDEPSWEAFSNFFDRPWFERMWTVQEIIQARKAIVVCGSYSLPWELVSAAARWICYKGKAVHDRHERQVNGMCLVRQMVGIPWRVKYRSEYLADLLGQKTRPTCKWAMRSLLEQLRPRLASDPRDKVYALVGISDLHRESAEGGSLAIDYSQSVAEVYTRVTNAIIKHDAMDDADVIWSARQRNNEPGWPSWVPDWRLQTGYGCEWGVGKPFKMSPDSPNGKHTYIPADDPSTLIMQGKVLGLVAYRSPYSHMGELFQHKAFRELHSACLKHLDSYPATGQDVTTAFAMTLIGGRLNERMKWFGTSVETYAARFLDFFDTFFMPTNAPEEAAARGETMSGFYKMGLDRFFVQDILDTYCERRLFTTDTGYMGLGHHEMLEGDVIAVVFGLQWPCVLRPLGDGNDEFAFIGEAYCHGMMDGEGMKDCPKDEEGVYAGQRIVLK
ncbi:heterokaryon incompatibility protein-domain-containing protein [Stachybotrys elegans]|uniref:Heterokaryon incompatibility protein-domain-containing protein n=1 Tax=Stachybotrys elegans TaxID=80388 RepID=A0A8K0SCN7_9HYPO|nr:heterokaryon incompatibility protein-domain-containing protein [Stachybotrys elegans]